MEQKLNLYIEKLKVKQSKLTEIFAYVSSKNFKIDEDEVEHIENYYNKREKLFEELFKIENELKLINISDKQKSDSKILLTINKNDTLIKNILECDKKNKFKLEQILNKLKNNIKSIKNIDKANDKYFEIYGFNSSGSYFDSQR